MGVVLLVVVLGGALTIALYATWYLRAPRASGWPPALIARRRALGDRLRALAGRLPAAPHPRVEAAALPDAPAAAAQIEADLLAGRAGRALAAAEGLVAAAPDDGARHLLLARALLAADQPLAAERAARAAAERGAAGPRLDLALGLAAHRARVLRAPRPPGAESPYPALLEPYELFVLELERHRRSGAGALWLAALGDTSLSGDRVLAAVTDHVARYSDDLERLLAAAEAEPALAEAGYHAARLAVKLGLVAEARALFDALGPTIAGSPDEPAYRRDLAVLRDQELPPAAPPPSIESGRRSIRLKILK